MDGPLSQKALYYGIGAWVCAILGGCIPFLGIAGLVLAILAVVNGLRSLPEGPMAIAGVVLGGLHLAFTALGMVFALLYVVLIVLNS